MLVSIECAIEKVIFRNHPTRVSLHLTSADGTAMVINMSKADATTLYLKLRKILE